MTTVTLPPRPVYDPRLLAAASAMNANRLPEAEPLLRALLREDPFDVRAIRLFAELAGRIGRYGDAENLLRRAIELDPAFTPARANLALVLYRTNRAAEALDQLAQVTREDPDNPSHANLAAAANGRIGAFDAALALYEKVLADAPAQPRVWMSYGHMLKTVGRQADGVAAYRRALALMPGLGEAWWSLANLKTVRFSDEDIAAMEQALSDPGLGAEDRWHLDFALGKAFEDRREAQTAFAHYAAANALRRKRIPYKADETTATIDAMIAVATPALFEAGEGAGCPAPDPIFVVGMPRAGSTLVEQILASHSQVEGTSELPDIAQLARKVPDYPAGLAKLTREDLRAMGESYLHTTRIQRHTARPLFIDKMPNNWVHVPLIRLILPRARIIDARRHPLGCCFSNFKQHFARGQGFSYDLEDMGRYYADYVRLMAHVDAVQPGAVHRVIYEAMVEETETQVRALLAACGLPFEEACLAFHKTERAVRTASSEQVRQPIFREGTSAWKPFEPWLDPLRAALGPVLESYPHAPTVYDWPQGYD
ncbi:tetratricopeptide repeat-containing sulfotransferase family protein [Novosphingobium pituita]|uniref:Tetratricopeptide repeat-containing sulfotransferase family protein n=1 Tax=Novosphingobium pituita TaxID=3056842 RepID=A0ABQ6P6V5_9SPHN|nr:sulfotransferase [Novosphingobium sp. IK01]GMM60319.1 tetratricopeptide repeat-containing sulfotransferase family protein [Novosphingobium sp. IK01]